MWLLFSMMEFHWSIRQHVIWKMGCQAFSFIIAHRTKNRKCKGKIPSIWFTLVLQDIASFLWNMCKQVLQESSNYQMAAGKGKNMDLAYPDTTPTILFVPSLKLEPLITYSAATHFLIRVGWNYYSNRIKLLLWHWLILPSFSTFLSPTVLNKRVRIRKKRLLRLKLPETVLERISLMKKVR